MRMAASLGLETQWQSHHSHRVNPAPPHLGYYGIHALPTTAQRVKFKKTEAAL